MAASDGPGGIPTPRPSPPNPTTSLARSNSSFSVASGASQVSIPVIGAFPYGSLHVHGANNPPSRQASLNTSREEEASKPTPLGGDVVLVLELPEKFTVGYDSISLSTRNFKGIKEIPAGAHFFWASENDAGSLRNGFWLITDKPDQIHVVQWDKFNDVLGEAASKTEARFQRLEISDVLPSLLSYANPVPGTIVPTEMAQGLDDLKEGGMWQRLTSCISTKVLQRVAGREHGPWHVHTTDRVEGTVVLPAERDLERKVSIVAVEFLSFSFTQTEKTYSADSQGATRTEQALDATAYMTSVLDNPEKPLADDDIVGELQLAFLVGMHLGNESCFHQWWHMAHRVFLRAYNLAAAKPLLAAQFLRALATQLVYNDTRLEGSILDFGAGLDRDLRLALTVYKRRLNELLEDESDAARLGVGVAFSELEVMVAELGWDLRADYVRAGKVMLEDGEEVDVEMDELEAEDERGEFAATVVQTDEGGRPLDLVSWS